MPKGRYPTLFTPDFPEPGYCAWNNVSKSHVLNVSMMPYSDLGTDEALFNP